MAKIFKYTAEHIARGNATAFVHELEADNIVVEYAMMDPMFKNQFIMFVSCDDATAAKVRDRVWKLNGGAFCDMCITTADKLEEYL